MDSVLKDIKECKVGEDEPNAIISLSRVLELAWDDLIAIDSLDEFCNVVTLGTLENKLPPRIQILWAQEKPDGNSNAAMRSLKTFIERQRKIAQEVLNMRGKSNEQKKVPYRSDNRNQRVHVGAVGVEIKKKTCFRCGFGHFVKDCRVPSGIRCRRCHKIGHIENACREPVSKDNSSKVENKDEVDSLSSCNLPQGLVKLPETYGNFLLKNIPNFI